MLKSIKTIDYAIIDNHDINQLEYSQLIDHMLFIPAKAHPQVKKNKFLARMALSKVLEHQGKKNNVQELEIINHHYVVNFPFTLVSIAHTTDIGIAAICPLEENFAIGVDIEKSDRPIKSDLKKYFLNQSDDLCLSPLEIWCLKEASFKALAPVYKRLEIEQHLTLKKIVIHNANKASVINKNGHNIKLELNLTHEKINESNYLIALAWIKNQGYY